MMMHKSWRKHVFLGFLDASSGPVVVEEKSLNRGMVQAVAAAWDQDDCWLNSKAVAELLDLSPDTVNELARKSLLPAFKKGRQWRFRKRDVASFKRQLRGATAA